MRIATAAFRDAWRVAATSRSFGRSSRHMPFSRHQLSGLLRHFVSNRPFSSSGQGVVGSSSAPPHGHANMWSAGKLAIGASGGLTAVMWLQSRDALPEEALGGERKTVFVTGGTSGLGCATVQYLAARGDEVLTCGRNAARVAELNKLPNVHAFVCDVTKDEDVKRLMGEVRVQLGDRPLHVLINNAGACRGGDPLLAMPMSEFDAAWDLNVRAVVSMTQQAWPLLRRSDKPLVINVGSTCSHPKFASAFFVTYPVSKAALRAISTSMRQEIELLQPSAQVVHLTTGAFQTELTVDMAQKQADILRSYGGAYSRFAEILRARTAQGAAFLTPKPAEEFAESVARLVHPSGESRLGIEYCLNVSAMERSIPWLPQALLDESLRRDCKAAQAVACSSKDT